MDIRVYGVIKSICMTTKSQHLFHKYGKITFEVNKLANKVLIRDAVEKVWEVKVENVRIINLPGKVKVFARKKFKTPGKKKAIVTLKKGYKIELPGQFESMGSAGSNVISEDSKG
jgi:large subunit ribosomal protein L23